MAAPPTYCTKTSWKDPQEVEEHVMTGIGMMNHNRSVSKMVRLQTGDRGSNPERMFLVAVVST
jgi:organic hydroperoxide reductase OsmC/OhrA